MKYLLTISFLLIITSSFAQNLFKGKGHVSFISEAPLEIIEGDSDDLTGIVDLSTLNFAFKLNVSSFEGFNSPLQKEHFNEHYLETTKYPEAYFLGSILLQEDCSNGCDTEAICKGKFTIHGITQIVTIPIVFNLDKSDLRISGDFIIKLSDYNIKIPKIVHAKIASEIEVNVEILMNKD